VYVKVKQGLFSGRPRVTMICRDNGDRTAYVRQNQLCCSAC
jgi:hypothetical protein